MHKWPTKTKKRGSSSRRLPSIVTSTGVWRTVRCASVGGVGGQTNPFDPSTVTDPSPLIQKAQVADENKEARFVIQNESWKARGAVRRGNWPPGSSGCLHK